MDTAGYDKLVGRMLAALDEVESLRDEVRRHRDTLRGLRGSLADDEGPGVLVAAQTNPVR